MTAIKVLIKTVWKKSVAFACILSMLLAGQAVSVQAGPLDGIGGWISDRANDVSNFANDAGDTIAGSDVGKFIGEKASAAGNAIGSGMSSAGGFIGENASAVAGRIADSDAAKLIGLYKDTVGEWIGSNAAAAGKMIGENAATARIWIGDNAKIAGSWIGESVSSARDWLGKNASNACGWIVENGTIVGAWIGETVSGAGIWIGENASAAGTMIGETASGAGIWVNEKVTNIYQWIEDNALFSQDGIAILGDNLTAFGIGKKAELEELAIGIRDYVANMDPSVYTSKEYYIQSGEKFLLGEYSNSSMTGLAAGLSVVASIVNLDVAMDLRDLTHDIQYIGDGSIGIVELGIDAASCLPVIGVVKNVKYLDDIKDAVKAVDSITDVADGVKEASRVSDVIDGVKDVSKAVDIADEVKDTSKAAEIANDVKDASKAVDIADEVKDVSNTAEIADDVKDASKVSDTAADMTKSPDVVDDVTDVVKQFPQKAVSELPEKVQENYKLLEEAGWDGEIALENMKEGTSAGKVFENWDDDLPVEKDGVILSYKEYDAYQIGDEPGFKHRGSARFVRDNTGTVYYTDDHYETYSIINDIISE